MEWLLALLCGLMCFGFLTEAKTTIHVQNPIMVALAGENLTFTFHVTVPLNQSSDKFVCRHGISKRELFTYDISKTRSLSWELLVQCSDSGEYYCKYKRATAYWVVLVREVGYRAPASRNDNTVLILNVALNVGLFLFSSIGSAILLKDYMKRNKRRDGRKEEGETVTQVGDEVATDSVYTALERETSSIYNVLEPSANDMDQKCVQQELMNGPCTTHNSQKEDGVFESVYENF